MTKTTNEVVSFCKQKLKEMDCPEFGWGGEYSCRAIAAAYVAVIEFIDGGADFEQLMGWEEEGEK